MARRIDILSYESDDGTVQWDWMCNECDRFACALPTEADARDEADRHDCDED